MKPQLEKYQSLKENTAHLTLMIELAEMDPEADSSKLERLHAEIEDNQKQIEAILQLIDRFEGLDYKILRLKYILGMKLDQIAYELGYSPSHIYKKHSEIMKIINFIYQK